MRRLMLLRHAKTETNAPSGRDIDRRLDDRGHSDAAEIGRWLGEQQEQPVDRVLVSPAMRARQTLDVITPLLRARPDIIEDEQLYNASAADLMAAIRRDGADAPCLAVVAHNPGLHELAIALTGNGDKDVWRALDDNLPTSGLIVIDFDGDSWAEAGFRRGTIKMFVSPKTLRQIAQDQGRA